MRRALSSILTMLAIVGVLVVTLALVGSLANSQGSSAVAREGQIAIDAEAALSATGAVRNAGAQIVFLEQGRVDGWAGVEAVDEASEQLDRLAREFERRAEQVLAQLEGDEASTAAWAIGAFTTELVSMQDALEGEPGSVPRVTEFPTQTFDIAVAALVDVRNQRVAGVLSEAEYAGQVADAVRFLVVFVIPVIAMLVLRNAMRRRRESEKLQVEVERQTDVISSKDEFVANLSHELKTPLTGVYGFALALDEAGFEDEDAARDLTGMIINEASELTRMVDDLITAGQVDTGNVAFSIEEVAIDTEIEAVIEPFERSGANITFSGTGDTAEVDRLRFRQIMRNLVSNAVKHGGPNIDVFTEYGGGKVSVFVMDDGDGISDEKISRLFDRYQHEGDEPLLQGSVGLGLAIARTLAEGMDGGLSYTRTNGLTYFVLRLPSHKVGRLQERVDDSSLGVESATKSASEVAEIFGR